MVPTKLFKFTATDEFEGGAILTEKELYELQSGLLCAQDYWKGVAKEHGETMASLAKGEVERYASLREQVTKILEAE